LDGAIVGLCFAEILGGMFRGFFSIGAGFGDVRRPFTVETEFVGSVHKEKEEKPLKRFKFPEASDPPR
jgi:hypothetical protein